MKALLAALLLVAEPSGREPALEWHRQPGAALRRALQRRAEILAVFGSRGCPWCRRLEEETLKSPRVRKLLEARVLLQVDIDAAPETARGLGVFSVPDLRLFNAEGLPLGRQAGYLPPEKFAAWLERASGEEPRPGEPSLKALRPDPVLDSYLQLEAEGGLPDAGRWEALLALAAGPSGETRAEALRLVKLWAPTLAAGLVKALESPRLKVRLAAREALHELGAPVEGLDPYAGPAGGAVAEAAARWLAERPAPQAPLRAPGRAPLDLERDLAALEGDDPERRAAARDRLVAAGAGIIEQLRERGRALRADAPTKAARVDEARFRLLLPPQAVRRHPDASERLSAGDSAARSRALTEALGLKLPGLGPLLREALCDPDPLFRETACDRAPAILGGEAVPALADLLGDPEPNVRTAAIRALAKGGAGEAGGAAEAIARYLGSERDPALIGHAARALQEAGGPTAKEALRSLLSSAHWSVRAAAVEALGKLKDGQALPRVLALLEDPDLFVSSKAVEATAALSHDRPADEVGGLVEALAKAMERRAELAGPILRALSGSSLRRSKSAVEVIQKSQRHPEGEVRAAAVQALAADRTFRQELELRTAFDDPDERVRLAAAAGLRNLVDSSAVRVSAEAGRRPEEYSRLRPALRSGLEAKDPALRLECALTFIYFGDCEQGLPAWKGCLTGEDAKLRERALLGLRWVPSPDQLASAVDWAWSGAAPSEKEQVIQAAGFNERGVDPAPALLHLLPRVPEGLRQAWAWALSRSHLEEGDIPAQKRKERADLAAQILRAERNQKDDGDRALLLALAVGLGADGLDEVEPRSHLGDLRPIVRRAALAAVLRRRVPLLQADLEERVRDEAPEVRSLALVGCMPPEIRGLFDDESRDWLGSGYLQRTMRAGSEPGWMPRFLQRAAQGVRLPESLLEERLRDQSPAVRQRAAALLAFGGSAGAEEALGVLHRSWREEPDSRNLQLLLQALRRRWDDRHTPILEEVYEALPAGDDAAASQLFGTVRGLDGDRIGRLKQRIHAERGEHGVSFER